MDELERCVLVKPEVFMYRIPPRQSARGYRAADWNLATPDWTGRLRCMVRGSLMTLRLEDKGSNELFAACPVEQFPGMSVEPVTDSSRYFVICIKDDTNRKAYIGIGFADRSDSFDLNVALQDHFKQVKKEEAFSKESLDFGGGAPGSTDGFGSGPSSKPSLDLAFKEGQTIRVNLNIERNAKKDKSAVKTGLGAGPLLLPPPPGAASIPIARPAPSSVISPVSAPSNDLFDLLGGLEDRPGGAPNSVPAVDNSDPWGDFTSAPSTQTVKSGS